MYFDTPSFESKLFYRKFISTLTEIFFARSQDCAGEIRSVRTVGVMLCF